MVVKNRQLAADDRQDPVTGKKLGLGNNAYKIFRKLKNQKESKNAVKTRNLTLDDFQQELAYFVCSEFLESKEKLFSS